MNKNNFIRLYLNLSIVFVAVLAYLQYLFTKGFMGEEQLMYSGTISSGLFNFNFENAYIEINVFNTPLIMFVVFALLSGFVAYIALREKPVQRKLYQDVVVYNVILTILFAVSNVVFMILIPDTVAGALEYGFFLVKFPVQGGDIANVFNFTYLFMTVYIILNIVVLQLTKETKFREKKEEDELDSEFLL